MKILLIILLIGLPLVPTSIFARDSINNYSIKKVMALEQTKARIGGNIALYFGDQKPPKILKQFGNFKTNKKTNAFGKTDKAACQWVFLSALIALRDRAVQIGGNAIINIKSNYRNNLMSSSDNFQCGAGAVLAGVALVGDIVTLKR